uniref:Highly divergent homeobox n=1 Tax=Callorhinchus milii TaxID=7868 RepID=A0A4W3H4U7_CALMI
MGDCPQMNLRSIFTEEQHRVLQRYYDSGMTNQSKNCFGLIIQCARETGLDFNVVRTWIGNKRRKLNSTKYNSDNTLPTHGREDNGTDGKSDTPVKSIVLIPPSPCQKNILTTPCRNIKVTGVFTSTQCASGQGPFHQNDGHRREIQKGLIHRPVGRTITEMELQKQIGVQKRGSLSKSSATAFCDKMTSGSRQLNLHNSSSTMYSPSTKSYSTSYIQIGVESVASKPAGWPKQHLNTELARCPRKMSYEPLSSGSPLNCLSNARQNSHCRDPSVSSLQIREVYSLASSEHSPRNQGEHSFQSSRQTESGCFSIAMETGDVDEYAREEELASMGSGMMNLSRVSEGGAAKEMESSSTSRASPVRNISITSQQVNPRDASASVLYRSRDFRPPGTAVTLYSTAAMSEDRFSLPTTSNQRLPLSQSNYQLQDRTQFSENDLAVLKKYWGNGMTSLGSICRDKIEAVSMELNVDCEIVKTWIGNRRRKYRQMGIDLPPTRSGPADFSNPPESCTSFLSMTSDESSKSPGASEENDKNEEDVCLSEGISGEMQQREEEEDKVTAAEEENGDGESISDGTCSIPTLDKVKLEILDDDTVEMNSCDHATLEVEQLQKILNYKNDEVRYLENELEKQREKYLHLQNFTAKLVLAIKLNDTEQQQMLLTNVPPETDSNLDSLSNRERC